MTHVRVLITGAGGMLGNAIQPYFASRVPNLLATDRDADEDWLETLDVRDRAGVARVFDEFRPDLVLHLAAETDLEFCELNKDVARDCNATGTRHVAELAERHGSTLVYVSTAGVFDGTKEAPYIERDRPNPIMEYGRTKLAGEEFARELCRKSYVVRAGWMVGGGKGRDHKFVQLIVAQILGGSATIHAVDDKWGTPTYTHDFARNLWALLETEAYGTYHVVCEGSGTRYDVARRILEVCRRSDIELVPVPSDFFKERYFAPRPRSEMMINAKLCEIGLNRMRPWHEALEHYLMKEFPEAIRR